MLCDHGRQIRRLRGIAGLLAIMTSQRQRGGLLLIGLTALVLFGLFSSAMLYSNSGSSQTPINSKAILLIAQAQTIRSQIARCATDFSVGDNGTANHKAYPLGTGVDVSTLTCPGTGTVPTIDAADDLVFSGKDGVFMPAPIQDFGTWKYTNDAASVRIWIDGNDARWNAAIAKVVTKFIEATTPIPNGGTRFELKITN